MTLEERIKRELTELRSGHGEISDAKHLSALMEADRIAREANQFRFSTRGNPSYFFGNPEAKTVLIMLNPCGDWKKSDHDGIDDKRRRLQLSLKQDIASYINHCISYGKDNYPNTGSFDLKQAAFLKPWKGSGVKLPCGFPETNSGSVKEDAVKSVLLDKLQLELIPYCSSRFDTAFFRKAGCVRRLKPIVPFLETVLDEIGKKKRKYVVFCSNVFETLFEAYSKHRSSPRISLEQTRQERRRSWHCRVVWIRYRNHEQKALIAHTFPSYSFAGGGKNMAEYGKFCFDAFKRAKQLT